LALSVLGARWSPGDVLAFAGGSHSQQIFSPVVVHLNRIPHFSHCVGLPANPLPQLGQLSVTLYRISIAAPAPAISTGMTTPQNPAPTVFFPNASFA